jgi:hypothetical protein
MRSSTTAQVIIEVRDPEEDRLYGVLRLIPEVETTAHSVEIKSYAVRRGDERFSFDEMPVGRTMFRAATDDIVRATFEDDEPAKFFEIEYRIKGVDESAMLSFRAAEKPKMPDFLFYQVEDQAGDWLPLEDVCLVELLPDSFVHVLETVAMEMLTDHNMSSLPMDAES